MLDKIEIYFFKNGEAARLPSQARPPAKPARHSAETQPMSDGRYI